MKEANRTVGLTQPGTYEIKVPGRLDESWTEWFEGMTISVEGGDESPAITTLTGLVGDEAALSGLLDRIYSLGLRLLSVRRVDLNWDGSTLRGKQGVDARILKECVSELESYAPFKLPATGWYFTKDKPGDCITFDDNTWTCMFKLLERVAKGERLCFSARSTGCKYAAFYLGFERPGPREGAFLGEQARVKRDVEFGIGHYAAIQARPAKEDYVVLERIRGIEDETDIEVVNLWVDAQSLTGLVTLASYDRGTNDSAVIPYAAGCQSIWTIPLKEASQRSPKAVVGCMDPVVRNYLPPDVMSFSVAAARFVEMSDNVSESFLTQASWRTVLTTSSERHLPR